MLGCKSRKLRELLIRGSRAINAPLTSPLFSPSAANARRCAATPPRLWARGGHTAARAACNTRAVVAVCGVVSWAVFRVPLRPAGGGARLAQVRKVEPQDDDDMEEEDEEDEEGN